MRETVKIATRVRAHFADGDVFAFIQNEGVKMRRCHGQPLLSGWLRKNLARFQIRIDFTKHPRISPSRTPDGDPRAARFFHHFRSRRTVRHIPVSENRNGNGCHDARDFSPIGRAAVELFLRPAVDRQGRCARCLRHARELRRIHRLAAPAETHFDRDRHAHRQSRLFNDSRRAR